PSFITIDPPDSNGIRTVAFDINASGEIVGEYSRDPDARDRHGFLRSKDGKYTRIDVPGAGATFARGINPRGDIVEVAFVGGIVHSYLRTKDGEFTQIDFPGATFTRANGINPRGDIVGNYCTGVLPTPCLPDGQNKIHGFLLSRGEFRTIDVPGALDTAA